MPLSNRYIIRWIPCVFLNAILHSEKTQIPSGHFLDKCDEMDFLKCSQVHGLVIFSCKYQKVVKSYDEELKIKWQTK